MSVAGAINRVLDGEPWAREKLEAHAGRVFRVVSGPSRFDLAVTGDGRVEATTAPPDLTLSISPFRLPSLLARPERFAEFVRADGDAALATTIADLTRTLPWFVEDALVRTFGPFAGPAIAQAGQRALQTPEFLTGKVAQHVGRYATEEAIPTLKRSTLNAFADDITALEKRLDALEARIAALDKPKSDAA